MHLLNLTIFIVAVTLLLPCASRVDDERHFILIYSALPTFISVLMRCVPTGGGRGNPSLTPAGYVMQLITLNNADHQAPQ